MPKLNLPQNTLEKEAYKALPTQEKEEYIHNFLKQVLDLNPNGITISQINEATFLGRSTIWHHLEILASRSQCLKMERGDTAVYHPNKVLENLKEFDIKGELFTYCFNIVENTFDKFLRVQLKQEGKTGAPRTNCGMVIRVKHLDQFLNTLQKIKEEHLNDEKNK